MSCQNMVSDKIAFKQNGQEYDMTTAEFSGDEPESGSIDDHNDEFDIIMEKKPSYLVEHLATFTVNKNSGIISPADGMRRLLQLEKTTGIWSQKMHLCLDHRWILIIDYETSNVIERFPVSLIQEPTAFTSTDSMELYNNILVFIVSGRSGVYSEMHIFQSQNISSVYLAEYLKNFQRHITLPQNAFTSINTSLPIHFRQLPTNNNSYIIDDSKSEVIFPTQNQLRCNKRRSFDINEDSNANPTIIVNDMESVLCEEYCNSGNNIASGNLNDETCSILSDKYERDVNILNHCFDDIEKFIARLQHAAAASRELDRRRRNRKTKKRDPGEGLLTLRTRPPHQKEFIDIFAKFKLSFNLLAKLKSHIHDPNAPELVHFLFTPLALIVEAASDNYCESQLSMCVVSPLLTREAINLLINCITSKETELWRSLGETWTVPRDQWKEDVGSYHPVFLDGWSPDYSIEDAYNCRRSHQSECEAVGGFGIINPQVSKLVQGSGDGCDGSGKQEMHRNVAENLRISNDSHNFCLSSIQNMNNTEHLNKSNNNHNILKDNELGSIQSITSSLQNLHIQQSHNTNNELRKFPLEHKHFPETGNAHRIDQWIKDLQSIGSKIVLVTYPRTANNDKELSVERGEYLEILDDTRKWWKVRNIHGHIAHVPHTIVTPFNYTDKECRNQFAYDSNQSNLNYLFLKKSTDPL